MEEAMTKYFEKVSLFQLISSDHVVISNVMLNGHEEALLGNIVEISIMFTFYIIRHGVLFSITLQRIYAVFGFMARLQAIMAMCMIQITFIPFGTSIFMIIMIATDGSFLIQWR